MNKYLLAFIIALLLLVIGGGAWEFMRPKDKPQPPGKPDTLRITKTDTLKVTSPPRISYRDRVEVVMRDTPKDSCCAILERCYLEQFFLSNMEIEAEKTEAYGSIRASFSMPRQLESGNGLEIVSSYTPPVPQVVEVPRQRTFFDPFGFGVHITGGVDPFRKDWSVTLGLGVHYDFTDR